MRKKPETTEKSAKGEEKKGMKEQKTHLTRRDLKLLKRAKEQGGKAWERALSEVRHKLKPPVNKSMSARANTAMPVKKLKRRVAEALPKDRRVTTEAGIALAAVLDYCVSELIDNACQVADAKKNRTITPRHIKLGVPQDDSLAELFKNVTIPQGGTIPTYHPELAQGYRKRKASTLRHDDKFSKDLKDSSPHAMKMGKKSSTSHDLKPSSGEQKFGPGDSKDGSKKDAPGDTSSSPAEK